MNSVNAYRRDPLAMAQESASFMSRVYMWMSGGVLLSAVIATYMAGNPDLIIAMVQNKILFYGLLIGEFGLVIFLSAAINRISASTATLAFLVYAAINGVTLSIFFLMYTHESIGVVFGSSAFAFAGLSLIGLTTKRDLGPVGTFCSMALFGMVGFAVLSWIFPSLWNGQSSWWYSLIGVLVFAGLTAYDTQKIKESYVYGNEGTDLERKGAIMGALTLYLDFINLFISLLRLMGSRRD